MKKKSSGTKLPSKTTDQHISPELKSDFENLIHLFKDTQSAMQMQAARSVDLAMVVRNWLFGWYIVEFESGNDDRKKIYGRQLIDGLSGKLSEIGIKGLSPTNLRKFREFYLAYKKIQQTVSVKSSGKRQKTSQNLSGRTQKTAGEEVDVAAINQINLASFQQWPQTGESIKKIWQILSAEFKLSWSHYVVLLTIKSEEERKFYEIEARENAWSIRELKRQISSSLYERLALSRNKQEVKQLSEKGQIVNRPSDIIKNPYILEFLGLREHSSYSENQLESAIIDKIEHFLLELGKGFLFEARQKRFTFDDDHFYVDLVFYNRLLRCYILIDLKRDKLTHQDLGQMQMYVNYFDRHVKLDDEKPTVGILLCHSRNNDLVKLTLPKKSNIYASEYQLYLPSKEELKKQLEEAQKEWEQSHETEI